MRQRLSPIHHLSPLAAYGDASRRGERLHAPRERGAEGGLMSVTYRDAEGSEQCFVPREAGTVSLQECQPVRRFPAHQRQHHMPGFYWSATTGRHIPTRAGSRCRSWSSSTSPSTWPTCPPSRSASHPDGTARSSPRARLLRFHALAAPPGQTRLAVPQWPVRRRESVLAGTTIGGRARTALLWARARVIAERQRVLTRKSATSER